MSYLKQCWYQAGWISELDVNASFTRVIADIPLLFFRGDDGRPAALLDRCPHRFAPLSAGRVSGGSVTCGYHGLKFDGSGQCIHNPHGAVTSVMKVDSYPVVDRHTALWIWVGDPARANPDRIPDLSYIDRTPVTARIVGYMPVKAGYELVTDNILDLSHADYIHPQTLGGMIGCAKATARVAGDEVIAEWDAVNCVPPPSFQYEIPPPNKGDIWIQAHWSAPAVITLAGFGAPTGTPRTKESTSLTLHSITPETAGTSHYFYCSTRPYFTENTDFTAMLSGYIERAFSTEDKPILEKQQMRMADAEFWSLRPILLNIDTAAVMARRKLDKMIADEAQATPEPSARAGVAWR